MRIFVTALALGLATSAFAQGLPHAQIQTLEYKTIDAASVTNDGKPMVVSFWATWCKPCVEELPFFEQLADTCTNKKVKIYLVTTDMRKDIATRVTDFIKAKKLTQQVVFINELNADKWINKVSEEWSGAIPATLMIKGDIGYKHFKEGELTFEELQLLVNQVIP